MSDNQKGRRLLLWVAGFSIVGAILATGIVLALNARTEARSRRQREAEKKAAIANSWRLTVTPTGKGATTFLIDRRNSDEKILADLVTAMGPLFPIQVQAGEQYETGIYTAALDGGSAIQNYSLKGQQYSINLTTTSTMRYGPVHVLTNVDGRTGVMGVRLDRMEKFDLPDRGSPAAMLRTAAVDLRDLIRASAPSQQ
jgi:hypothetical protein